MKIAESHGHELNFRTKARLDGDITLFSICFVLFPISFLPLLQVSNILIPAALYGISLLRPGSQPHMGPSGEPTARPSSSIIAPGT